MKTTGHYFFFLPRSIRFIATVACLGLYGRLGAQILASSLGSHEVFQHDTQTGARLGVAALISATSGGLSQPHGLLDRSSGLLVASFGDHTVKRYDRFSGTFLGNFIPDTSGLSQPVYLALGPDDALLYVSSQGNDRILRFDATTGAAVNPVPFISGGSLDGPSGFGWSPDGSILYVAGRYSANVLAYQASTGAPLDPGHVLASGLGAGSTFGLCVDPGSGDVFVATGGSVRRYRSNGVLVATIATPGAIGLEMSPDQTRVLVAASNNLYAIRLSDHTLTGPLLTGATYSTLNFFHFSRLADARLEPLQPQLVNPAPGHAAVRYSLNRFATEVKATVQLSSDLLNWVDGATHTPNETSALRDADTDTVSVSMTTGNGRVVITERAPAPLNPGPPTYFRVQLSPR